MGKVTLVYGGDWLGLYVDGKLKREGHQLFVDAVLNTLGIEFESIQIPESQEHLWEQWNNRCPPELTTVRKNLVKGWPG